MYLYAGVGQEDSGIGFVTLVRRLHSALYRSLRDPRQCEIRTPEQIVLYLHLWQLLLDGLVRRRSSEIISL